MDRRTPASAAGADRPAAQRLRDVQGEMIGILLSVASGALRDTDTIRAAAILRALGVLEV